MGEAETAEGSNMVYDKRTHGCCPKEMSVGANRKIGTIDWKMDAQTDRDASFALLAYLLPDQNVCIIIEAKTVA